MFLCPKCRGMTTFNCHVINERMLFPKGRNNAHGKTTVICSQCNRKFFKRHLLLSENGRYYTVRKDYKYHLRTAYKTNEVV